MRAPLKDDLEKVLQSCNSMNEIREAAKKHPQLQDAVVQSLQQPVELIQDVFQRLSLKEKKVMVGQPATSEEVDELWQEMQAIDGTLLPSDSTQAKIRTKQDFLDYLDTAHSVTTTFSL